CGAMTFIDATTSSGMRTVTVVMARSFFMRLFKASGIIKFSLCRRCRPRRNDAVGIAIEFEMNHREESAVIQVADHLAAGLIIPAAVHLPGEWYDELLHGMFKAEAMFAKVPRIRVRVLQE